MQFSLKILFNPSRTCLQELCNDNAAWAATPKNRIFFSDAFLAPDWHRLSPWPEITGFFFRYVFFSDFVILSTKIPHRQDSLRGSPAVFAAPCGVLCWYACVPVLFIGLNAKSAAASLASASRMQLATLRCLGLCFLRFRVVANCEAVLCSLALAAG